MNVELISHSPNPEKLVSLAAKLCYSPCSLKDLGQKIENEDVTKFIDMLVKLGHESPLEHISFTFAIEGVSRTLLAQLTRHRIASYSVQSQRYVKSEESSYVIPPSIEKIPEAKEEFLKAMEECKNSYDKLTKILMDSYSKNQEGSGNFEKKAIEDARYVLPNAWHTKIICTFNARSLLNFFNHRCCSRAQWEIRELAVKMLKLVKAVAPSVFKFAGPSCLKGACSEGKMSCGKAKEVREFFGDISAVGDDL